MFPASTSVPRILFGVPVMCDSVPGAANPSFQKKRGNRTVIGTSMAVFFQRCFAVVVANSGMELLRSLGRLQQ